MLLIEYLYNNTYHIAVIDEDEPRVQMPLPSHRDPNYMWKDVKYDWPLFEEESVAEGATATSYAFSDVD